MNRDPASSGTKEGSKEQRSSPQRTILEYVILAVVAVAVALLLRRPARPSPFLGEDGRPLPGSISEKIRVRINGVEQGMFIKGRDAGSPVLLYLHGGMPDYFLSARYPTGLDEYFTVAWWEQRGSGLSYSADLPPESVTPEQLVSDALEVTDYLRTRFGREKIYLMGHSGGTFIGIQAAARAPERYHAYIGVAQMSNQLRSERLAYDHMLRRFEEDGNAKMVRKLSRAPVTDTVPLPDSYLSVRDVAMHRLGIGTTHDMESIVSGLLMRSVLSREYTLGEKIGLWRGKIFSGRLLWNTELATDLTSQVTRLEIPVYFLHGVHDYTVSYTEAKSYYEQLDAPLKGFYTFARSAHSPLFEEPERMREIMQQDVLTGANGLADGMQEPALRPGRRTEAPGAPVTGSAVILDMDGLMFDTERLARDAWRHAMAEHGYALDDAVYLAAVGRTVEGACGVFVDALGPDLPIADIEAAKARYLREMLEPSPPLKNGLLALLGGIDALGLPMAVASATSRAEVERRLVNAGLLQRFGAIAGGDEVTHGKPAPDLFVLAAARLGANPRDCVVLEDSEAGIKAAAAAGMAPVMVPDLVEPSPSTRALARAVLPSLAEALGVIRTY